MRFSFYLSLILVSWLCSPISAWASEASKIVQMKSISYEPKKIEIHVGDSLQWTNVSYTEHSATAEDSSFETGLIPLHGTSKKIQFSVPGVFKYHCSLHGKTMSGQVTVVAAEKSRP